jgi:hypothetical protein
MQRRTFIRIAGGGVVLAAGAAGAGAAAVIATPDVPAVANAPWREAGAAQADVRRRVLSHAILAPNPHNLQPWLVDLSAEGEIVLFHDRDRLLPHTDPYARQLVIGHGCFLELASIAATAYGMRADVEAFPDGAFGPEGPDGRPVARIRLTPAPGAARDPLFAEIPRRRSVKEPFDTARPVAPSLLADLAAAGSVHGTRVHASADPAVLSPMRGILAEGSRIERETPRTHKESVDVMRLGSAEIARHRDGIDLGGGMLELLIRTGVITREALADPASGAFAEGARRYDAMAAGTPAVLWTTTPGDDRHAQVAAGRGWARLALEATARGLSLHPMSQVLQEYPEMADLQRRFLGIVGAGPDVRVQMLARVGYGPDVPASPRRGVDAIVRA